MTARSVESRELPREPETDLTSDALGHIPVSIAFLGKRAKSHAARVISSHSMSHDDASEVSDIRDIGWAAESAVLHTNIQVQVKAMHGRHKHSDLRRKGRHFSLELVDRQSSSRQREVHPGIRQAVIAVMQAIAGFHPGHALCGAPFRTASLDSIHQAIEGYCLVNPSRLGHFAKYVQTLQAKSKIGLVHTKLTASPAAWRRGSQNNEVGWVSNFDCKSTVCARDEDRAQ